MPYEVTLGRYGTDCTGRGTCGFMEPPGTTNSRLSFSKEDTVLKMQLLPNKFSAAALQKQFGRDITSNRLLPDELFVMEDDYPLPVELKDKLQIPSTFSKIPKGNYKTEVIDDYILIHFKIK